MRMAFLLTFVGFGIFAACSTAPKPAEVALTDQQVEEGIRSKFVADADLRAANLDVDADVSERKVTVSGKVASESVRSRAVEIAQSFQPGFIVNSKIDVKPLDVPRAEYTDDLAREAREKAKAAGNTIGDSLDDAWIHTKIMTKLVADRDTPGRHINVDVDKNVVTLRGNVDTALAKSEAERIAKETEGVKRVKNLLIVGAN